VAVPPLKNCSLDSVKYSAFGSPEVWKSLAVVAYFWASCGLLGGFPGVRGEPRGQQKGGDPFLHDVQFVSREQEPRSVLPLHGQCLDLHAFPRMLAARLPSLHRNRQVGPRWADASRAATPRKIEPKSVQNSTTMNTMRPRKRRTATIIASSPAPDSPPHRTVGRQREGRPANGISS